MSREVLLEIDVGDVVICDLCSTDYTSSTACGGMLFAGKGVCPQCMPRMYQLALDHGELHMIQASCPKAQPFRDFILMIRGGNNVMRVERIVNE